MDLMAAFIKLGPIAQAVLAICGFRLLNIVTLLVP
jgi:hypothetical protein